MKSLMCLVFIVLVLATIRQADAQSVIPPLKIDDYKFTLTGTSRSMFSTEELPNNKHFDWNLLRLRLNVDTSDQKLTAFFEVEAIDADEPGSNWLRMGYLSYQIDKQWTVLAGRLFLAAPYYSTPPFFLLETAHFPQEPWSYYAYGVQVEGILGNDWSLIVDVSGKSGVPFDDGENFDRLETSGRLEKQLSKSLSAGLLYQLSEDFVRGGADFHYTRQAFALYGEVYAAHESDKDVYGGYVLNRYEITKNVIPHLQFDFQHSDPGGDNFFIVTPGVMFRTNNDNLRFIIDYEWHIDEPERSGIYGVLQIRF